MMAGLSAVLGKVFGSSLLVPGLFLALLIAGHQLIQARDEKVQLSAKTQCDTSWLAATFKRQVEAAKLDASAAQTILEEERQIRERLSDELQDTHQQMAQLRNAPPVLDPDRCLSDGMLDALRRRRGVDGGRPSGSSGS